MAYKYDVFLSYLRQKPCDGWVRDHFRPYFEFQLGNALNRPLAIFVDTEEIHVGQKWPNRLKEALVHSRCLVGIWTPLYFHSKWCRIESAIFSHREKQLGIGQNDDSEGLIAGIKVNDGIHFPEFARDSHYADFERYFFDSPGFPKSERYVEFQEAIPPLCTDVARIIDKAPAWSEEWCTKAWIDDVIIALDAVPPAEVTSTSSWVTTMGSVITFYSYKGGVGRTMTLANVACMLAKWGKNVLIVDWDLEAPGLEHFFPKSRGLDLTPRAEGLVELLNELSPGTSDAETMRAWRSRLIELQPHSGVHISLLTAGSRSETYFQNVRNFDVEAFYEEKKGGRILETLRSQWKDAYDFVLIDSRTGITDLGGVCTIQMPDILVLLFTATEQSLIGAVRVASKATLERQKLPFDRSLMPILPVPSKFDTQPEPRLLSRWLGRFQESVSPLYETWLPKTVNPRDFLEITKIPYVSFFSFGEGLPVIQPGTSDPTGLGYAYETLAALLGNRLQNADLLLERRDLLVELVRAGSTLPHSELRDIPARSVLFIQPPHGARYGGKTAEPLQQYEKLLLDSAAEFNGTIAMSTDEGVVLGFSDVAAAVRCGVAIQESLAITRPILLDRNPFRPRMAIDAATASTKKQPSTALLYRRAVRIADDAKAGQIPHPLDTVGSFQHII